MPSPTSPTITLKVGGATYDRVAGAVALEHLVPFNRDAGSPTLEWSVLGGPIQPSVEPFRGRPIDLYINTGAGDVHVFSGDCRDRPINYASEGGWHRRYTALGLRDRMDRVPFSGDDTPDTSYFNLDPSDPNYRPERAGRTVGEILRRCLDSAKNAAALIAEGIGRYTSSGSGATATSAIAAGAVTSASVTSGGTGYTAAPTVIFFGGGGYGARGTATVAGGVVTGVSITSGGHGYGSAPEVWISTLPSATLNDLTAMTTVYPAPVRVGGEKLGAAVDQTCREAAPNSWMHVLPDGTIRFYDLRSLGRPLVAFLDTPGVGTRAVATVVAGVITAIAVTSGGTGHDAANPPTVLITDASGTGATATCTVSGGAVVAVAVTSGGSGYSSPVTLTMGSDPVDVAGVSYSSSVRECFQRVVVRGQDRIQAIYFDSAAPPGGGATDNGIAESFAHDSLTNAQAKAKWKLGDFTNPLVDGGQGTASASINTSTHVVSSLSLGNGGYGYATTPVLRITGGGGTGATGHVVLSGGTIVGVVLDSGGTGYTSTPAVTIDAPSGAGGDAGTCTCPSTTQVTVTSSEPGKTWAANYWDQTSSGRKGELVLSINGGAGITSKVRVQVVSNTALAAGGTSTFTVTPALPSTGYTSYTLVGLAGGASQVWRRYVLTDAAMVAGLRAKFPRPTAWHNADGSAATMVNYPVASVLYSAGGLPPFAESPVACTVDRDAGAILLDVPAVTLFGTTGNLKLGGGNTDGIPAKVRVLLPIATGQMSATYPPDSGGSPQYAGTSHSIDGLTDTLTVTIPGWRDDNTSSNMLGYAADLFDSVSDVVQELAVPWLGLYPAGLAPGLAIDLAGNGYATGLESAAIAVTRSELRWNRKGSPRWVTTLGGSTRRAHHAAAVYERPAPTGIQLGLADSGAVFSAGAFAAGAGPGSPVSGLAEGLTAASAPVGLANFGLGVSGLPNAGGLDLE